MREGDMFRKNDEYKNAIASYRKSLEQDSSLTDAHLGIGFCQIELMDFADAEITYGQLLVREPRNERALYRLGQLHLNRQSYPAAVDYLRQALSVNPGFADSHYQLGLAHGSMENYQESISEFRAATEINPGFVDAWYTMGNILTRLKQRGKALEAYSRVLQLDPKHMMALYMSGDCFYSLGKYKQAVRMFERTLGVNFGYTAAHTSLKKSREKLAEAQGG